MRELFLQRLLPNVRMALTQSAEAMNLEQLAQLADRIIKTSPTPIITATNASAQLIAQVTDLTRHLDQLTTQITSAVNAISGCSRSQSPGRRRQPSTTDNSTSHRLCWYHRKFGEAAKKCQPPCQMSENDQASR